MKQYGLSLIELMISIVLGLLLLAGIANLFQANRQTFQSNQGLFKIQESVRTAFELISRDLRQAGFTKCGNGNRVASVLNATTNTQLLTWLGFYGVDAGTELAPVVTGSGVAQRVAGTSAILVQGMQNGVRSLAMHDPSTATFTLNSSTNGLNFVAGDVLMVCDYNQASIFQASNATATSIKYGVNVGSPGNCQTGLGLPGGCGTTSNYIAYSPNSSIARLMSTIWYVGRNGRSDGGGSSLYRVRLGDGGVTLTEEIVAGIADLQITYHRRDTDSWDTAASLTTANWSIVDAVRLNLKVVSTDTSVTSNPTTNSNLMERSLTQIIALRNRVL